MKIIHRYVLSEIAGPYLIALFTFTLVTLLHRFSRLSDLVVAKGVPAPLVGKLLLSLLPRLAGGTQVPGTAFGNQVVINREKRWNLCIVS